MFAVFRSLIDLVAEIVGGTFRLVGSCFGLVLAAMILIALAAALVLHLV